MKESTKRNPIKFDMPVPFDFKKYGRCTNRSSYHSCNGEPWDCFRVFDE